MDKIKVKSYESCGRIVFQPVCNFAKLIGKICKKNSLSPRTLKCLVEHGFEIEDTEKAVVDFKSFLRLG